MQLLKFSLELGVATVDLECEDDANKFLIGVNNFFGELMLEEFEWFACGGVNWGCCCIFGEGIGVVEERLLYDTGGWQSSGGEIKVAEFEWPWVEVAWLFSSSGLSKVLDTVESVFLWDLINDLIDLS